MYVGETGNSLLSGGCTEDKAGKRLGLCVCVFHLFVFIVGLF